MSDNVPSDRGLPNGATGCPDVATFMMARAFAEVYRDMLAEPVPEPRWRPSSGR